MNQKATLFAAVAICSATAFIAGRISSNPSSSLAGNPKGGAGPGSSAMALQSNGVPSGPLAAGSRRVEREAGIKPLRSQGDPTEQMASIFDQADALVRGEAWLRFVKGLGVDQFEQVVAEFRGQGHQRNHRSEYTMLLAAWAQVDPIAALDYATENTRSSLARQTILATWANNDPTRAIEWAKSNHEGGGANPLMVGVIRGIASTNPDLATDLIKELPRSYERGQALIGLEDSYLRQGPEIARNWALSFEDKILRGGAILRITARLAHQDPVSQADWLLANASGAAEREYANGSGGTEEAMSSIMKIMAENDPQQAISYFNGITGAGLRKGALEGITIELAAKDPHGVLGLIEANPTATSHSTVRAFLWSTRDKHPELGAQAIGHIQADNHRDYVYREHLQHWISQDRDAALNWMNQNPVSDQVRERVERFVERLDQRER